MQLRVKSSANLRAEPDKAAAVVAALPAGAIVTRTGRKQRRWVPVSHEGRSGWIADRRLERLPGGGGPDAPDDEDTGRTWTEAEIVAIIRDAGQRHGQPVQDLVRVARCESNLDPRAVNPAGPYHGLFQFLRSTFASTPFGERNIFDPEANANAAAWMWQQGRRNEWVCQ